MARDGLNGEPGITAYRLPHGWLMFVPENDDGDDDQADADDTTCTAAVQIITYARSLGCDYVLFDRDVEPRPELPVYDW